MNSLSTARLQDFFEQYARCVEDGNAREIAAHFATPCIMISDERSSVFTDSLSVEVLFLQGFAFLRKHNIASAKADVRSFRNITPNIIHASLIWSYYDAKGRHLYSCNYIYGLHHTTNGWKIETALSVNEKERLDMWLANEGNEGNTDK